MDSRFILDLLDSAGSVGLLVFIIVAIFKGWLVRKAEFDREVARRTEVERERNDWRELALRGTDLAEGLASVTTRRVFGDK